MRKGVLVPLYIGLALLLSSLSVWWLLRARTGVGMAIGILGLVTAVLPYAFYQQHKRLRLALSFVFLGIMLGNVWAAPDGHSAPTSPISHQFTTSTTFPRYHLTNLIPEEEQFNLGWHIMPYLDPIMTVEQAQAIHDPIFAIYDEMGRDPHFKQLGTVTGWGYGELWGRPFNMGHYYLYIPPNQGDAPLPAIIFLHGTGGNFKSYMWLWSKLAAAQGFVVIAPTFGFGSWRKEGGTAAVFSALDHASSLVALDPDHIHLAGLSNGGLGISLTANSAPERFRGLIFISPALATEIVSHEPFLTQWQNKPILLITGAQDRRLPIDYIGEHLAIWQERDLPITAVIYPDADHFLIFTQADSVFADISQWLHEVE